MGYWTISAAGRLPLAPLTFSNTYNLVAAVDSKSPFFTFEFVNRLAMTEVSARRPRLDTQLLHTNGPLALSMSAG
jgi:hypothetical protein